MGDNVKNVIPELLTSWRVGEAVQLAREDEEALIETVKLVGSEDKTTALGALSVLEDLLPEIGDGEKFRVLREGFDYLLAALNRGVPLARKAIGVLRILVRTLPLSRPRVLQLISALRNLVESEGGWPLLADVVELASELRPIIFDDAVSPVREMVLSDDPRVALLGTRLAVSMGVAGFVGWCDVLNSISRLLRSDKAVIVELALGTVSELGSLLSEAPVVCLLKTLYSPLKELALSGRDAVLRGRAMEVFEPFKNSIVNYYRSRPLEARDAASELLREGFVEEAVLVASASGYTIDLLRGKVEGIVQTPNHLRFPLVR